MINQNHKKFGHASLRLISKLKKHNIVRGLPSLVYKVNLLCDAYQKGKQIKDSFKSINVVSTSRLLELLHIDLFGPIRIASLGGKHYGLVVVYDYTRWTWVTFLAHKENLLRSSLYSTNLFKMKMVLILLLLLVIIRENLKIKTFNNFVKNMKFILIFVKNIIICRKEKKISSRDGQNNSCIVSKELLLDNEPKTVKAETSWRN
ncbi:hypothetical protein CR513_22290, partial [Mucuna pruriens]